MSASDTVVQGRGRRQLLSIIALFLLPPIAAWLAWSYLGEQGVSATTNAGELISPPRPLELQGLRTGQGAVVGNDLVTGRWTLVLFDNGSCQQDCGQQLYITRQTRLAMNKDVSRVQRLLIFAAPPSDSLVERLAEEQSDLQWVVQDAAAMNMLRAFRGETFSPSGQQYFLVDPLGNLMMVYDLKVPPRGLMKDLQKLLKISQVG
jgi:hypothetical protein